MSQDPKHSVLSRENREEEDSHRSKEVLLEEVEMFDKLLDWEAGLLSELETWRLFQAIVSSGLLPYCSGPVRRTAAHLIRENRIRG